MTAIQIEPVQDCIRTYDVSFDNVWQARITVDEGFVITQAGHIDMRTIDLVKAEHLRRKTNND